MNTSVSELVEILRMVAGDEDCPVFLEQDGMVTEYGGVRAWIAPDGSTTGLVIFGSPVGDES